MIFTIAGLYLSLFKAPGSHLAARLARCPASFRPQRRAGPLVSQLAELVELTTLNMINHEP